MKYLFALLIFWSSEFVVDVSTSTSYRINLPRGVVRGFADDIGLFRRNMPGVVGVDSVAPDIYRYRTEKSVPLAGTLRTDFVIARRTEGDSVTTYESVDRRDPNYMFCSVTIVPESDSTTHVTIHLRLRLVRESAFAIHWMAPILGERFIEARMREDMEEMLTEFIDSSNDELQRRFPRKALP